MKIRKLEKINQILDIAKKELRVRIYRTSKFNEKLNKISMYSFDKNNKLTLKKVLGGYPSPDNIPRVETVLYIYHKTNKKAEEKVINNLINLVYEAFDISCTNIEEKNLKQYISNFAYMIFTKKIVNKKEFEYFLSLSFRDDGIVKIEIGETITIYPVF